MEDPLARHYKESVNRKTKQHLLGFGLHSIDADILGKNLNEGVSTSLKSKLAGKYLGLL